MTSPISDFYGDRSVLVTGATGFMGKVLVEKLLRSCPAIRKVYLLMRPKHGQDVRQRLEEMLGAQLFETLKHNQPQVMNKLVAVKGDVMEPDLGMSMSDRDLVGKVVSVVFHCAATVKFDEALKLAVEMNVAGTRRVVELCRRMTNLASLVHVSTAYCNCDREEVSETVHALPVKPQQLIDAVQWMDNDFAQTVAPKLIGARPNTYTYTKAMAEYMLVEECGDMPVAIVRPSIVTAAWKEPIPGWVDNLNGPIGLLIGGGKGLMRSTLCQGTFVADFIPVDIPINLMIAVGWYTATHRSDSMLVYNCTSGDLNPITWNDMVRYSYPVVMKNPLTGVLWYPTSRFPTNSNCQTKAVSWWREVHQANFPCHDAFGTKNRNTTVAPSEKDFAFSNSTVTTVFQPPERLLHNFHAVFLQYVTAYIIDSATWLFGRKRRMVKIQEKVCRAQKSLEYFTTHQWRFTTHNVKMIWEQLQPEDKELFPFDVTEVMWFPFWQNYWLGGKLFVLGEDLASIPVARTHLNKMLTIAHFYQMLKLLALWRVACANSAALHHVATFFLSAVTHFFR